MGGLGRGGVCAQAGNHVFFISSGYWKQINCLRSDCRGGQDFISKWFLNIHFRVHTSVPIFNESLTISQSLSLTFETTIKGINHSATKCTTHWVWRVGEFLPQMYVSEAKWTCLSAGVRPQQEGWSRGTVGAEDSEDFHVLDSPVHIT